MTGLHQRAVRLEHFSIGWMLIEAGIAVTAGIVTGSLALPSFGFDSVIELVSATLVLGRRSAGRTGRSRVCASIPRRNASFAISAFTAAGDASTGPVPSHRSRVIPIAGSVTSRPSSAVSSCASRSNVSRCATSRACATRLTTVTGPGPGRITFAEIRYSHTSRNSSVGESCSIARASRNSSSSFNSNVVAVRHPRYCAASRRCSVRVFARCPYERITSG